VAAQGREREVTPTIIAPTTIDAEPSDGGPMVVSEPLRGW
jgi:hypothetical protein